MELQLETASAEPVVSQMTVRSQLRVWVTRVCTCAFWILIWVTYLGAIYTDYLICYATRDLHAIGVKIGAFPWVHFFSIVCFLYMLLVLLQNRNLALMFHLGLILVAAFALGFDVKMICDVIGNRDSIREPAFHAFLTLCVEGGIRILLLASLALCLITKCDVAWLPGDAQNQQPPQYEGKSPEMPAEKSGTEATLASRF